MSDRREALEMDHKDLGPFASDAWLHNGTFLTTKLAGVIRHNLSAKMVPNELNKFHGLGHPSLSELHSMLQTPVAGGRSRRLVIHVRHAERQRGLNAPCRRQGPEHKFCNAKADLVCQRIATTKQQHQRLREAQLTAIAGGAANLCLDVQTHRVVDFLFVHSVENINQQCARVFHVAVVILPKQRVFRNGVPHAPRDDHVGRTLPMIRVE
mmetsp:Transcript_64972/g.153568  ORF Transcript_64972/g.153568 Transcript_64972/m.153568 type:complete len:210 (-) Transcript_64972:73-702(-)